MNEDILVNKKCKNCGDMLFEKPDTGYPYYHRKNRNYYCTTDMKTKFWEGPHAEPSETYQVEQILKAYGAD